MLANNKYIEVPVISQIEVTKGNLTNIKGKHNPIRLPITTTHIIDNDTTKAIINPPLNIARSETAKLIVIPSIEDIAISLKNINSQSLFFTSPSDKLLIMSVED